MLPLVVDGQPATATTLERFRRFDAMRCVATVRSGAGGVAWAAAAIFHGTRGLWKTVVGWVAGVATPDGWVVGTWSGFIRTQCCLQCAGQGKDAGATCHRSRGFPGSNATGVRSFCPWCMERPGRSSGQRALNVAALAITRPTNPRQESHRTALADDQSTRLALSQLSRATPGRLERDTMPEQRQHDR